MTAVIPVPGVLVGHLLWRGDLCTPQHALGKCFAELLFYLGQRQALSWSQSQEGEQMVTCFCQ